MRPAGGATNDREDLKEEGAASGPSARVACALALRRGLKQWGASRKKYRYAWGVSPMSEMTGPEPSRACEEDDDSFLGKVPEGYVVLPVPEAPGHWIAVFADGSYVRDWVPS